MMSIKQILQELAPDIALVTETHLKHNLGVKVDDYTFFGKNRDKGEGGGVGIFVKNSLKNCVVPLYTKRNLEIMWVTITRKNCKSVHVGVYYGKQEQMSKQGIEEEMENLTEEILEMNREGEIILCMDGNGKIGLIGEPTSRNGKLLRKV